MRFPQRFLSSPELLGEEHPLFRRARYRLQIYRPDGRTDRAQATHAGRFLYQEVPVEVTSVVPGESGLRLITAERERTFCFPEDATVGRSFEAGKVAGEIVFLGYGLRAPDLGWDDLAGIDLQGKVALILETTLPEGHPLKPAENRRRLAGRAAALRVSGAAGVVTIISEGHEARLAEKGLTFDLPERLKFPDVVTTTTAAPPQQLAAFPQVEVRHEAGAAILGCALEELARMSETLRSGKPVAAKRLPGRKLEIEIGAATRKEKSFNVVAILEGPIRRSGGSTSPSARTTTI